MAMKNTILDSMTTVTLYFHRSDGYISLGSLLFSVSVAAVNFKAAVVMLLH